MLGSWTQWHIYYEMFLLIEFYLRIVLLLMNDVQKRNLILHPYKISYACNSVISKAKVWGSEWKWRMMKHIWIIEEKAYPGCSFKADVSVFQLFLFYTKLGIFKCIMNGSACHVEGPREPIIHEVAGGWKLSKLLAGAAAGGTSLRFGWRSGI